MNVVDPRGLDPLEWVDRSTGLLIAVIPLLKLESGDQWRRWGYHVRQILSLRGILIPNPDEYQDFEDWAMRFNQVIAPARS
jgi:hypothetical protein